MSYDPWGTALAYDPSRDEATEWLANLSDAELIELFGTPDEAERVIPAEVLASPTLGAIRRAQGNVEDSAAPYAHMLPEARVAWAFELVQEARRRVITDQLDSIYVGLSRGADPSNVARRLHRLAERATQ